jgi:hypothetical protein
MTGAIITGAHMTSITIVIMMTTITIVTTTRVLARTGNTINAKPRHLAGFVLLLVALKHQFAFS